MEITKEAIEERIKRLEADREQALANANALEGAILDCQYWIGELSKENGGATGS